MKKVTLLLPDKVLRIIRGSRYSQRILEDLTAERLVNMLCQDDYHDSYRLMREDVEVLSIEEYVAS